MADRTQVLRAAARLLIHRPHASMAEIADTAGISRATLHRLVHDRPTLFTATAELSRDYVLAMLETANLEHGTATEALTRFVHGSAEIADLVGFLINEPRIWQEDEELEEELDRQLTGLFLRGQESGEFRIDHQAKWMTDALIALLAGAAWSVTVGRLATGDLASAVLDTMLAGRRRQVPPQAPG